MHARAKSHTSLNHRSFTSLLLPYFRRRVKKKKNERGLVDFVSTTREKIERCFLRAFSSLLLARNLFTRTRARASKRRRKLHLAIRADSRYARFVNAPLFSFILLLSFCFIDTKFLYLSSRMAKDEKTLWERTDKGGSVREFWLAWASFSLFFCFGMCKNLKISEKSTLLETFVLARVDDIDSR